MNKKNKVLHLTLKKKAFEVMVTGEKCFEIRKVTKWITSRLWTDDGSRRDYDYVHFVNGYGKTKPYFKAVFLGFRYITGEFEFSNGLKVSAQDDIIILLGEVFEVGYLS